MRQLLSPALQCARRALTSTVAKVAVALAVTALPSLAFAEAFDTAGIDEAMPVVLWLQRLLCCELFCGYIDDYSLFH